MSDAGRSRAVGDEQQTGWALLASGQTVQLARPVERLDARILDFLIFAIPVVAIWAVIRGRDAFVVDELMTGRSFEELLVAELGALLVGVLVSLVYESFRRPDGARRSASEYSESRRSMSPPASPRP